MTPNIFFTRSEIKRAVWMAQERFPGCRPGQAFINQFGPEWDRAAQSLNINLWETADFDQAVQEISMIQQMNGAVERLNPEG